MAADISERIRAIYSTLSKGQKKIANAVLNDYDKVAYLTAAKLGDLVGVSESTVVRFADELGFEGYSQFQFAVQELVRIKLTPNQWIEQHAGQPLHIGGIIVAAEDRMSQKGNPWGKYIIEDYTGSYQFSAFGETYLKYAALLKPNAYVHLGGTIQQRGAQFKFFKPKPIEEAEYEFSLQQVQLIKDAQKDLHSITLQIPIENVQPDLIDALLEVTKDYPGETPLHIQIFDNIKQNVITFNASPIRMTSELFHKLQELQTDDVLQYKVEV